MKSLLTLKTLTGFLTVGSVIVGVKAVNDANFNSNEFMNEAQVQVVKRLDDQQVVRHVASAAAARPAVQYLPLNTINSQIIDGEWEIRRIQDENNEVVFEVGRDEEIDNMEFKLIGTSLVKIGDEEPMDFRISYLDESGKTIALFRQFGKGYEIIEAVRRNKVEVNQVANDSEISEVVEEEVQSSTGVVVEGVQDLILERALHPTKDPNILRGEEIITGTVVVSSEKIEEFDVVIGIGKNYEMPLAFIDGGEIKAGGQFSAQTEAGEVTGLITNNGKDGYRIRFATGPLQGAVLNFVTEEKLEQMNEQEEEAQLAKEEAQELNAEQIEIVENQNDAQFSRRSVAQESDENIYEIDEEESEEEEEIIEPETEEEFARITKEVGFDFTQPSRVPASK
ncbi:hypothetical protein A9Q84_20510 [Halobacteriovorax marinus]|uniref:Uncharacterized protein n=1 Tax=Halobacteriovorax marinus TaxID=97084 RepID=A0A1Y5F1A6_9BACT|nr:hypothetical protein A9Q84_20510 [Halobacteriovorax marinus]